MVVVVVVVVRSIKEVYWYVWSLFLFCKAKRIKSEERRRVMSEISPLLFILHII